MLPKPNRLKKEKDFDQVFKKGKSIGGDFLFLKVFNRDENKESRFGFVVSTKVDKKATVRNKVKRRLREIVRSNLAQIKKGKDVVIVAQPKIKNQSFDSISNALLSKFKKAGLL